MFDIFNEFATDPSREIEGTWRDLGKGASILVARANNRNFSRMLSKLYDQNKEALEVDGPEADDKSDEVMIDVVSKTILKDWKGISYKGVEMAYSLDNAKMLLAHADFRALVGRKSNEVDSYKVKQELEQGKA